MSNKCLAPVGCSSVHGSWTSGLEPFPSSSSYRAKHTTIACSSITSRSVSVVWERISLSLQRLAATDEIATVEPGPLGCAPSAVDGYSAEERAATPSRHRRPAMCTAPIWIIFGLVWPSVKIQPVNKPRRSPGRCYP